MIIMIWVVEEVQGEPSDSPSCGVVGFGFVGVIWVWVWVWIWILGFHFREKIGNWQRQRQRGRVIWVVFFEDLGFLNLFIWMSG